MMALGSMSLRLDRITGGGFSPADFFLNGANGFWLDNDPSTWFEDSAMTIPATFGNPIGAWKDKSGNAIDALQSVSGARPTYGRMPYGGVRNQLLNTAVMSTQSRVVSAVQKTISFTGTGTITLTGASTAGPLVGTGVSDRVSLTFTPTAGSLTMTVTGSVTLAQLENAATPSNYQQVVLGWDVTEVGVASVQCPWFDGVDDFLDLTASGASLTQNIGRFIVVGGVNFTKAGTNIQNIFNASSAVSPASTRLALGMGAASGIRAGGRRLDADDFQSVEVSQATFENTVAAGVFDYSNSNIFLRRNGAVVASSASFQTNGNTQNTASLAVQVGANTGSFLYLGGFIPSVFAIADTNLSDAQLLQLETYMAQQIGGTGL